MKRAAISALFALHTTAVLADVSAENRNEIIEIAHLYSTAFKSGEGVEFAIETTYLPFARAIAIELGLETAEQLFDGLRNETSLSEQVTEIHRHDVFVEFAVFGMAGDWTWGMVPYLRQTRARDTDQVFAPNCYGLFVFGKDGAWFTRTMSERSNKIFMETLKVFQPEVFPEPQCANRQE